MKNSSAFWALKVWDDVLQTDKKEHKKGFDGNMDCSSFWALPVWNKVLQTDKKLLCPLAAKEVDTTVAETKDGNDTPAAKREIHKDKKPRNSGGKLISRKVVYTVIVGASFAAVVAIFSFVMLPKQQAALPRCIAAPYSDLVGGINDGSVTHVQFVENSRKIYYNTKSSIESPQTEGGFLKAFVVPKWQYRTRNVGDDVFRVIKMLKDKGITYGSEPEHLAIDNLFFILNSAPACISLVLWCYELNNTRNLTRKRRQSKKQSTTFDDVEGVDDAKAELLEIVSCINGHGKYEKLGAKVPRGVLLAGPPGTGKTLLARAVAGEAGVAFFPISGSELVELYVGVGAARVRDLFRQARKRAPSIIFIDEIDAVGGQRGTTMNSELDQTLNQLLTEMDGFEKGAKVVVIAATNRPESLDSALMRPGRFSRKVNVDEPDEDGRRKIFRLYLKDIPMAMEEEDKQVICKLVASRTPGLVGADLENIAHESVLLAARRDGDFVTKEDVLQALERARTKISCKWRMQKQNSAMSLAEKVFSGMAVTKNLHYAQKNLKNLSLY